MKIFYSYAVALILGLSDDAFLEQCYNPEFRRSITLMVRLYILLLKDVVFYSDFYCMC